MYKIFSVKLLFEHISSTDTMSNKIYEETINIIRAVKLEDVDRLVKAHYKDVTYKNIFGEDTTIKLAMILDVFELVDNIEESLEFVEVYSQHIILDEEVTVE
ncbi:protein of unknown function [Paenisporosarcina quisquiliarum]|jgi:hypothetical protein|uniref:DUF4288 domain-containing protein n=1 Tax=Psychrobacillus TaxID=1221880 RepID=UPI0008D81348|nr:DUF4288 domain-containing protein [Psychrobacillus psychrodurans]MCK1997185.1 DUF4288 domain-containing protein [Psychrobacillus psychrodurans]MCZ8541174.1 DUF4288 domain-containing protein [Psychrobacillus psychrodurans]SEN04975.1 protein of unknown function [Paenisporosarcina quisquiliarum]SFM87600.1 protein of unknown function [Psychrobacillus psychrodurans]